MKTYNIFQELSSHLTKSQVEELKTLFGAQNKGISGLQLCIQVAEIFGAYPDGDKGKWVAQLLIELLKNYYKKA